MVAIFNKYLNTKNKRITFIILLLFSLILLLLGYSKLYSLYRISIPCIFFKITGLYCPGCGITRTFFSLIKFDIITALQYNLLIFLLFPFLFIFFGIKIKNWILFKNSNNYIYSNKLWNFLLVITILFGILRNIDVFSFLAPIK